MGSIGGLSPLRVNSFLIMRFNLSKTVAAHRLCGFCRGLDLGLAVAAARYDGPFLRSQILPQRTFSAYSIRLELPSPTRHYPDWGNVIPEVGCLKIVHRIVDIGIGIQQVITVYIQC